MHILDAVLTCLAWALKAYDGAVRCKSQEFVHHCNVMQGALAEAVSGVYSGWASIGSSPEVYMTAMSIGERSGCSE